MDVYVADDLPFVRGQLLARLRAGEVGILPTDTLYGLSGDASRPEVVRRIQRIKRRNNPPSLIPPSLDWAEQAIAPSHRERFAKLHATYAGPFTMLFPSAPGPLQRTLGSRAVGLRLPAHWVRGLCEELGGPLVTTSVNRTGEPPMQDLSSLDPRVAKELDFLVYEGPLPGPPSTLVWLDGRRPRLIQRST